MADSKKEQKKNRKRKPNNLVGNNNEVQRKENAREFDVKKIQKGQKNKNSKEGKYQNNVVNKNFKNREESDDGSPAFVWLTRLFYIALVLGFLYVVDFEKFAKIRDGACYCLNKTVSFLPPAVVKQGEVAVEYIRPVAVDTVNKINVLINDTSTFFNTNPLVKEHWTNVREISSICSARLADYMRTLYVQTTGYCLEFKKKLF